MKTSELHSILKSAPVPEPPAEFWQQFPGQVTEEIRARSLHPPCTTAPVASRGVSLAWLRPATLRVALGTALACALVLGGFLLGFRTGARRGSEDLQLAQVQKCFHEIQTLFPNQLRAIVFDDRGPELVLADTPSVPSSQPLYIKVTGPKGSRRYITFSGQQIQVNGEICDVLADRTGNVVIVGQRLLWASTGAATRTGVYQIEAHSLAGAS